MSTLFLCAYCALTLALLTADASMALLERVGVERGEPLVRGEAEKQNKKAVQKKNENKNKSKIKSYGCNAFLNDPS
jgi:hypothetical protein